MGTKGKMSYRYWAVAFACLLSGFIHTGGTTIYNCVLPLVRDNLGLTASQASLCTTFRQAFNVLFVFLVGACVKKVGTKGCGLLCFLCMGSGVIITIVAPSFPVVLVGSALNGVALGLNTAVGIALFNWFDKYLGTLSGMSSGAGGLATLVLAVPLTTIARSSMTSAATVTVVMFSISAVVYFILMKEKPEQCGLVRYGSDLPPEEKAKKKSAGVVREKVTKKLDKKGQMLILVLSLACGVPAFTLLGSFTLATTHMGYDPAVVAGAYSMTGLAGLLGRTLYGWFVDRLGAIKVGITYMVFTSIAALTLFLFCDGSAAVPLYIAAFLVGWCLHATTTVGMNLWARDISPEEDYNSVFRNFRFYNTLSGLIFQMVPGIIADVTGSYKPLYLIHVVCYIFAGFLLVLLYKQYAGKVIKKAAA